MSHDERIPPLLDEAAGGRGGGAAAALALELVAFPAPAREGRLARSQLRVRPDEEHPAVLAVRKVSFDRRVVLRLPRIHRDRLIDPRRIRGDEKMHAVHEYRPAGGDAVLMLAEIGLGRPGQILLLLLEQRHPVEALVAEVLKTLSGELVRAALGDNRHDAAGGAAEFRGRLADVDAEFANAALRKVLTRIAARALLIRHTVDQKRALADRAARADADADAPRHRSIGVRPWHQQREIESLAGRHRHRFDLLLCDDAGHLAAPGFDHRRLRRHGDGLLDRLNLHRDVKLHLETDG